MNKTYSELIELKSFKERFEYLRLDGVVGESTFGSNRFVNQEFYRSPEWKRTRNRIIDRDLGCDLGIKGREIHDKIIVHHINPVTLDDIIERRPIIFDPENLICSSDDTHNGVHYGDEDYIVSDTFNERKPNDTSPWKL